jgi:NAD dependent epimerase/dehydratase family enzyme
VRNAEFAKALGRALHRPAVAPVPAVALHLLYGAMAAIVTDSQNVVAERALALGFNFAYPAVELALRDALSRG